MFLSPRFVRRSSVSGFIAILLALSIPASAGAQLKKNHLTLGLGYQKLLSDDLKDSSSGIDFTNSVFGSLAYRLSLSPKFDLTLDACGTTSTQSAGGVDVTLTGSFFGPGIRFIAPHEGVRPFVQANFFFVDESVDAESGGVTFSTSDNSVGFGLSAGVDIRASKLLSVPIEADYMYGKPADDISGLGINVGLTFNFGTLKTK